MLAGASVPACLLAGSDGPPDSIATIDLLLDDGRIAALSPAGHLQPGDAAVVPMRGGLVWPCFADLHCHIDKAHQWNRAPNLDGTFQGALAACATAPLEKQSDEDFTRRMEFSLLCAYAHGTRAVRTHLDSAFGHADRIWRLFAEQRARWSGRIALQAVALISLRQFDDAAASARLAHLVREHGGLLGGFVHLMPDLDGRLDALFDLADRHDLDLDLHADETGDPAAAGLRAIAEHTRARGWGNRVTVGHCCSLAVQPDDEAARTADVVAQAGLTVVSLPACNLYLQDRSPGRTPRWRGVTLLHELKARGVPVALAGDNVRDSFHPYGDSDMLEVFREAVKIGHLDHPFADWPASVTSLPASRIARDGGLLAVGAPADLVAFRARTLTELLARPQSDRVVIRSGAVVADGPPDYALLD